MKKWFVDRFLPMWAKQTVLADNRYLTRAVQALQKENRELRSYIEGLERGIRTAKRIQFYKQGGKK